MADIALVVIGVDGTWGRLGGVPEDDRAQVRRAAAAGIHIALATRGTEPDLRLICRMLRLDAIPIVGAGMRTEHNGKLLVEAAASPEPVLDALVDELAAAPDPLGRGHILVIGSLPTDEPLLRAGAFRGWIGAGAPCEVQLQTEPMEPRDSGVGWIVGEIVLRNNRFLRPASAHPRFSIL